MSEITLDEALELAEIIGKSQSRRLSTYRDDMIQEARLKVVELQTSGRSLTRKLVAFCCMTAINKFRIEIPVVNIPRRSYNRLAEADKAPSFEFVNDEENCAVSAASEESLQARLGELIEDICETEHEVSVAKLAAGGANQRRIAKILGVDRNKVQRTLKKLGDRYVRRK